VSEAVAAFRPAAESTGVRLEARVDDEVPLMDIDPVRIREVVSNLVANALRHTPADGSIDVVATLATDPGFIDVTVRDTGTGIDPDLLPHVFERFAKTADSRGSGLGLAIARGLVEAHGGSIEVTSSATNGTTFTFRLPAQSTPG
jgi:two-component system sensor histidine kinase BaeS